MKSLVSLKEVMKTYKNCLKDADYSFKTSQQYYLYFTLLKVQFLHSFFQGFEAGFERIAVAKIPLCLSLDFGRNDGALLPRLTRL